jgi:hypothetical protein
MIDGLNGVPRLQVMQPGHWYRIHSLDYHPLSFNPNKKSSARFSPFSSADGTIVASLYAGSSVKAALMETVFHEVPVPSSGAILLESDIIERKWVRTDFANTEALTLIDFTSVGLQRVGLTRSQVIDTTSAKYPFTQGLAQRLYAYFPQAHGIRWVSRLYDEGTCIVLFEDRMASGMLIPTSLPTSVLSGETLDALLDLVEQLDMSLIFR